MGSEVLGLGLGVQDKGQAHKELVWDSGLRPGAWGLGPGAWGLGPGAWGLGPGAWGLGPGAWGLGPGAWGLGPGAWDLSRIRCGRALQDGHTGPRSLPDQLVLRAARSRVCFFGPNQP